MIHRGTGILVAGQPYVDFIGSHPDVTQCHISQGGVGHMLPRIGRTAFLGLRPEILGMPSAYFLEDNRIHLWPTPDKAYSLHMSWNTNVSWPQGWYAGYEAALAAVTGARKLLTGGRLT